MNIILISTVTKKLTSKDCEPLVDRILARIKSWSSKLLSYAGRLQLIQSVLFCVQYFWFRNFMLPKGVLQRINQICAGFLWHGKEKSAQGARVSWKAICFPKSEGGLGLKDTISWNKACILQNIWAIITKAGSLWIAWLQAYVLKGRSLWKISLSLSYGWS